ncbi:exo-beta-N-acetylmuramidase NamZ family protein [Chitinophaga lutea]
MKRILLIWLLCGCLPAFAQTAVKTGAERTEVYLPLLAGKRVGLLVNQTSIIGPSHLVDSLLKRNVKIAKIFSPEHGFRGTADAGEKLGNSTDPATGIPIVSLYGSHRKADAADLADVDVLIFDLQDVGVRFYTYISSLQELMESAAQYGKPLIVLDRPNPNGHYVDGPVLDTAFRSFVGMQPIPTVHGMTVGEYAKMLNGERWLTGGLTCALTVIPCENYTHTTMYSLPVKPSPNLQNMTSIYLYPGVCLFEGTALSLGRGTDKPFQVYGHPSLPKNLYSFTPRSVPGAKKPPLLDQTCYGYDLSRETGPQQHIRLDFILNAYKLFPDKTKFFNAFFNKLAGNNQLMEQIKRGESEAGIRRSWEPGLQQFRAIRKKYLLYKDF